MTLQAPLTLAEMNKDIKHDLTPDPSWQETGEFHKDSVGNRFPVYVVEEPLQVKVPKRDFDGQIMYHLTGDGRRIRPMWDLEIQGHRTREFIYVPVGNGCCERNFNFRPAPGEVERERMQKARREQMAALENLPPTLLAGIVDAIKNAAGLGAPAPQPDQPAPVPVAPPAPAVAPVVTDGGEQDEDRVPRQSFPIEAPQGGGFWYLSEKHRAAVDGGSEKAFRGSRAEARKEIERRARAEAQDQL
jgi:hypothetical protein